jgi:hypothetical protein
MSPDDTIILDYSDPVHDCPGFWGSVWGVVSSVFGAIAGAFTEAIVKGAKELAAMLTLDKIVGVGVNYAKQQASTALTHGLMSIGNQQWIANLLHAAGLDFSDLLRVGKDALNAGFGVLTTELSSTLKQYGLMSDAGVKQLGGVIGSHVEGLSRILAGSSQASSKALTDHALLTSKAYSDWTMFSSRNYSGEEEKMRAQLSAIFTDTPERINERTRLAAAQDYITTGDAAEDSIHDKLPGVIKSLGAVVGPLQNWLNEQFISMRNSVFSILVPQLPVSYEQVGSSAFSAFVTAFGLGLTAHGVAVAADLIHPLKATGLPQLSAFLADMAGFGAIAKDTWYTDLTNFLGTPYKHFSLRYFRPTLPHERELTELYAKGLILEDDFDAALGYHGYRDEWIRAFKMDPWRHPRIYDLATMLQDATMDSAAIYRNLRSAEYGPDDADVLTRQVVKRSLSTYMTGYRSQVMRLFELGYVSEDQFDDLLQPLGLSSEALFLMKKTARFAFIEEYTNLSLNMFKDMFDKDLMDDADLETSLAGLGIVTEKRDVILAASRVKKAGRVAAEEKADIKKQIRKQQTLVVDTYVLAYRAGTIDEGGLLAALQYAGLSEDLAVITVGLERQKKILEAARKKTTTRDSLARDAMAKLEAGYISLYQRGLIDENALTADLLALGFTDADAAAIVAIEREKKAKPPALGLG